MSISQGAAFSLTLQTTWRALQLLGRSKYRVPPRQAARSTGSRTHQGGRTCHRSRNQTNPGSVLLRRGFNHFHRVPSPKPRITPHPESSLRHLGAKKSWGWPHENNVIIELWHQPNTSKQKKAFYLFQEKFLQLLLRQLYHFFSARGMRVGRCKDSSHSAGVCHLFSVNSS